MREVMLVNQIHSIGDILFIQPLCKELKAVLPVRDHLSWMNKYLPFVKILPMSECSFFNPDDHRGRKDYIPLRWANQIFRGYALDDFKDYENCMLDKYRFVGLDPMKWKELEVRFMQDRAEKLFKELNLPEHYVLVNNHSQAGSLDIKPKTDLTVIQMESFKHYHVLDWYLVISRADEFHTVSTCTFYMLQAMRNQKIYFGNVYIYPRPNKDGLRGIKNLNPDFDYYEVDV